MGKNGSVIRNLSSFALASMLWGFGYAAVTEKLRAEAKYKANNQIYISSILNLTRDEDNSLIYVESPVMRLLERAEDKANYETLGGRAIVLVQEGRCEYVFSGDFKPSAFKAYRGSPDDPTAVVTMKKPVQVIEYGLITEWVASGGKRRLLEGRCRRELEAYFGDEFSLKD